MLEASISIVKFSFWHKQTRSNAYKFNKNAVSYSEPNAWDGLAALYQESIVLNFKSVLNLHLNYELLRFEISKFAEALV